MRHRQRRTVRNKRLCHRIRGLEGELKGLRNLMGTEKTKTERRFDDTLKAFTHSNRTAAQVALDLTNRIGTLERVPRAIRWCFGAL
jgi:hypothetical protein